MRLFVLGFPRWFMTGCLSAPSDPPEHANYQTCRYRPYNKVRTSVDVLCRCGQVPSHIRNISWQKRMSPHRVTICMSAQTRCFEEKDMQNNPDPFYILDILQFDVSIWVKSDFLISQTFTPTSYRVQKNGSKQQSYLTLFISGAKGHMAWSWLTDVYHYWKMTCRAFRLLQCFFKSKFPPWLSLVS